MTQPYYMLDFSAGCCMFQIRVNDIPVMTLDLPGQAASIVPINFGILQSGKQTITATLLPHSGQTTLDPEALLEFDVKMFDVQNDFVFKEQLCSYTFAKVNPEKSLPVERYRTEFIATVPYQLKGWTKGVPLKDVEDMGEKLKAAYYRIANLISNKHYDRFREVIHNREHIMTTSMYLDEGAAQARIEGLIDDFESGFEVAPIAENAVLQVYADGRAAALKKLNGEPALYLVNEKTKEELMIDLMFYVPEGKTEFEVI